MVGQFWIMNDPEASRWEAWVYIARGLLLIRALYAMFFAAFQKTGTERTCNHTSVLAYAEETPAATSGRFPTPNTNRVGKPQDRTRTCRQIAYNTVRLYAWVHGGLPEEDYKQSGARERGSVHRFGFSHDRNRLAKNGVGGGRRPGARLATTLGVQDGIEGSAVIGIKAAVLVEEADHVDKSSTVELAALESRDHLCRGHELELISASLSPSQKKPT